MARELSVSTFGPTERRVRFWLGITSLAAAALAALYVDPHTIGPWWATILIFSLLFIAVEYIQQSRSGVCPAMAALGLRTETRYLSLGGEKIQDQATVAQLRRIALRASLRSVTFALGLTVLYWLLRVS